MTKPKLLLVGAGAMGGALLRSWNRSSQAFDVTIIDPNYPDCIGNISDLSPKYSPDIILFAIKPQLLVDIILKYFHFTGRNCLFVSIIAGVSTRTFSQILGESETIVRVMPNLPVTVGKGMAGLFCAKALSTADKERVESLFSSAGEYLWLDSEDLMDVVTAISGSGPAYFFRFVECLAAAGVKAGLTAEQSMLLARQTLIGAGAMIDQLPETASDLRAKVTSPGGTTAAALAAFDQDDRLGALIFEAVMAAVERSRELGNKK